MRAHIHSLSLTHTHTHAHTHTHTQQVGMIAECCIQNSACTHTHTHIQSLTNSHTHTGSRNDGRMPHSLPTNSARNAARFVRQYRQHRRKLTRDQARGTTNTYFTNSSRIHHLSHELLQIYISRINVHSGQHRRTFMRVYIHIYMYVSMNMCFPPRVTGRICVLHGTNQNSPLTKLEV